MRTLSVVGILAIAAWARGAALPAIAAPLPLGYVVANEVPLPHARPEAGVLEQALPPAWTYSLTDEWSKRPWEPKAGHFRYVLDMTSLPDGRSVVLDRTPNLTRIHVLDKDGGGGHVFNVDSCGARRVDTGRDPVIFVLQSCAQGPRVSMYDPDGGKIGEFGLPILEGLVTDLAVTPEGSVVVASIPGWSLPPVAEGRLVVVDQSGSLVHSAAAPPRSWFGCVDVDESGAVFSCTAQCAIPSSGGGPTATPRPTPTQRPSYAGRGSGPEHRVGALTGPPNQTGLNGISEFTPDLGYVVTSGDRASDLTATDGEVYYVSSSVVHSLRSGKTILSAPSVLSVGGPGGIGNSSARWVDAQDRSRLLFAEDSRYGNSYGSIARPDDESPQVTHFGAADNPPNGGPRAPVAIAASDDFLIGDRGSSSYSTEFFTSPAFDGVQRWRSGAISIVYEKDGPAFVDVAADGDDIYVAAPPGMVIKRTSPWGLDWYYIEPSGPAAPRLGAIAAHGGRLAILDSGNWRVIVLDRNGVQLHRWDLRRDSNVLPTDLAIHGEVIYLTDLGRDRVLKRGLDGSDLGEFPTHDGPRRIATDLAGDVFVLGRGGFGLRYSPTGTLTARWRVPDLEAVPVDIAVDELGRVAIGYWKTGPDHRGAAVVRGGGVWIFSPAPLHADPRFPDTAACQLTTDKLAEPGLVRIGAPVTVTLKTSGRCPGRYDPVQLMLVVDTSYSMSFDDAMARAKSALLDIVKSLNPDAVQLGLVTFDTGGTLESRLTHDIGSVHAAVTRLGTDGDTLMGAGIELARVELMGDNHDPDADQVIWLVSDGAFKDQPTAALEAARADGIDIFAVIFPTWEYRPEHEAALIEVLGSPDRLLTNIDPQRQRGLVEYATRYVPVPGLAESITVEDLVPDNMRYEPDSASPPAVLQDGRLTWTARDVSATSGLTLTYRLRPREEGTWPTNVRADATYVDALGYEGVIAFPVPVVDVEPAPLYLPVLLQNGCARTRRPLDVFLLVDTSGSMGEPDPSFPGRTKLQAAIDAGRSFIDILNFPMDRVGLVSFDKQVLKTVELTLLHQNVEFELITMRPGVGTRIDLGLEAAATELELTAREGVTRAVVLLSDGRQNGSHDAVLEVADRLKADDVGIYTVALGQDSDSDLLARVASRPDMALTAEPSALRRVYQEISGRLTCDGWRRMW